ncbi:glycosyltransferase family 2 protein [bacterium]|nr:glycosyltransferase family 2 protein [bacterium]MBU1653098.1 glycosyltransferase family 2 protein [bacterium]
MGKYPYKLSIVTANTNERHFTLPMLDTVYKTIEKSTPFEYWIVDNNSQDGSVDAIREQFPQVNLICNKQNAGFTEANNQAIRECQGEYIFCLNPDTIVHEGAIDRLVDYLDSDPKAGIVGSKLLNGDGTLQSSCRNFMRTSRLILQHAVPWYKISPKLAGQISLAYWDHNSTRPVDWILGASLMIRRECLNDIGLKDEEYFIFHEDSDWCWQAWKHNWKVVFVHDSVITHFGSATVGKIWGANLNIEVYKAQHQFISKNMGESELFWHRAFLTTLLYTRLMKLNLAKLFGRVSAEDYRTRLDFLQKAIEVQRHVQAVDRKPQMKVSA